MVCKFSFKTFQDKINLITDGNCECKSRQAEKRLKEKTVYFTVVNVNCFFKRYFNMYFNILCIDGEKLIVFSDNEMEKKYEFINNFHKIGHCGVIKTKEHIDNISYNIKRCDIAEVSIKLWERYMADCISLLEYEGENRGYKYILNVIDCYSKYMWVTKLKNKSAVNLRSKFEKLFSIIGPPKTLHTDNGREFKNSEIIDMQSNESWNNTWQTSASPITRTDRESKPNHKKMVSKNVTRRQIHIDIVDNHEGETTPYIEKMISDANANTKKLNIVTVKLKKDFDNNQKTRKKPFEMVTVKLKKDFDNNQKTRKKPFEMVY
ncbi:hypothetical protein A3Q56_03427 [Intoshia linei]|uniref:Integrase catalytic domain-containing protein n=1 Tax=Intoshia linei TaxID=1819745 RepID=A0A177B3N3_9BILA|nr:hypothetical protein A3Q56_03427 [Intoshia linei]